MVFSTILICFLWVLKDSRELSSKVTVLLCISVQGNVYTSNSICHAIAIASVVNFETIIIYPQISTVLAEMSTSVEQIFQILDIFEWFWHDFIYFKLVCFKTSNVYFVSSKYVTKSQITNHKINLKTFLPRFENSPF